MKHPKCSKAINKAINNYITTPYAYFTNPLAQPIDVLIMTIKHITIRDLYQYVDVQNPVISVQNSRTIIICPISKRKRFFSCHHLDNHCNDKSHLDCISLYDKKIRICIKHWLILITLLRHSFF